MNKKGIIQNIGMTMIFIFIAAIIFLVVKYSYGEVVDKAVSLDVINSSQVTVDAFNDTKNLTNRLDYVGFVLLVGLTLVIIISGWLVSGNPILSFIYFIFVVLMVPISAMLSYVWGKVSAQAIFSTTLGAFPILDLVLTNFPLYIVFVSFFGLVAMFLRGR